MKTFVLSADDMQQFTKLIYEQQKTEAETKAAAAAVATATQMAQIQQQQLQQQQQQHPLLTNSDMNLEIQAQHQHQQLQHQQLSTAAAAAHHVMSFQYYIKQPTTAPSNVATTINNGNNVNYPSTVIQQSHLHPQHQQQQQIHHTITTTNSNQQAQQPQQQQQQIPNLNHLRIKQPNGQTSKMQHQHQIGNSYQHAHQHHPYYGSNIAIGGVGTTAAGKHQYTAVSSSAAAHLLKTITTATPQMAHTRNVHSSSNSRQQQQHQYHHQQQQPHQHTSATAVSSGGVPVHALNQNSNFSAASSSTGGGTNSSHAPTQQSNTTGSSLSPPAALSANPRTVPTHASHHPNQIPHNQHNNNNSYQNKIASNNVVTTVSNTITPIQKHIIPPPRYTIVNANASAAILGAAAAVAVGARTSATTSTAASCKKIKTEPLLSEMYKNERLNFANAHLSWSQESWRRLLIHDERKFNLDGPDGYSNYYHDLRNNERLLSQRPRGNSVYIHLLVTAAGPIHIEVATSKIGDDCIIDTLIRQRSNIIVKLGQIDFMLQDHNWTTNVLPAVHELLNTEGIKTQKWPTIAHDFDIMENIWGWIIREVYDGGRKFSRKDDLIFRIREAWARLPMDLIRNLYSTMPERISELYQTLGNYTNC